MTVATCENSTNQCNNIPPMPYEAEHHGAEQLRHTKDNTLKMTVGGVTIILSQRKRTFSLSVSSNSTWSDAKFIPNGENGYAFCATKSGSDSGSVSEDATFIDTELYFCDPAMGVLFWKETKATCKFSCSSSAMATFSGAWGGMHFHKLPVGRVVIDTVETYCLLVNGVKETIETVTSQFVYNDHLYLLWPAPPSLGYTRDADLVAYGFYDYNAGGPGEAEAMAMRDGGKDFYYPEWLQSMGVNRSQDVQDALDRYYAYYLGDGDSSGTISIPPVPYSTPRGNAVKDSEGNIALSFSAATKHVNRIYGPDGKKTDIAGLFTKQHIYPVGVL